MGLKASVFKLLGLWAEQGQGEEIDISSFIANAEPKTAPAPTPAAPETAAPAADSPELTRLREELAAKDALLAQAAADKTASEEAARVKAAADLEASFGRDAEAFALGAMKERNRFLPASRPHVVALLAQLNRDDHEHPVASQSATGFTPSRSALLQTFVDSLTPHNLLGHPLSQGDLPEGAKVIAPEQAAIDPTKADPAEVERLMALTETGRAALERRRAAK